MARGKALSLDEQIAKIDEQIAETESKKAERMEAFNSKISDLKAKKAELLTQREATKMKKLGEYIASAGMTVDEAIEKLQSLNEKEAEE